MSNKTGKVIGGILLAPFVLIALGIAYCEANKAYWDHKVKELCEKDGGVKVFEKLKLTKEEYEKNDGKNGAIHVMPERTSLRNHEYAWKSIDTVLHESNPDVWRTEYVTYRKSDRKELGKWITYTRRGGDMPTGISHDSSFSCSDIANFDKNLTKKIFLFEGE